jgi:hypothetical protein
MLTNSCMLYDSTQVRSGICDVDVEGKDRMVTGRDQQQCS